MRAVICNAFGEIDDLEIGERPAPPLAPDQVRIRVAAAGLNFPDVLMIQGKYQVKPPTPFVPGMECAGTVTQCGAAVSELKPGDRVMVFGIGDGCFAEEVCLPATRAYKIPDAMPFAVAAGFPVVYGTSYYALTDRGHLKPGEVLVVHGASGGVGLTAVEIGKALGATVIGTGGSDIKLSVAERAGADHVINYSRESIRDRVRELTQGRGADVIYDAVGGDATDQSMRSINRNGRLLVIGFTSGRIPKVATNLALLKECSIVGVSFRQFGHREPQAQRAMLNKLMDMWSEGRLKPHVSATYPLARIKDAMQALMARQVTGKVVLTM